MRRKTIFFILFTSLQLWCTVAAEPDPFSVTISQSSPHAIRVEIQIEPVQMVQQQEGTQWRSRVELPGCSYTLEPGKPRLPIGQFYLGIPPEGTADVSILETSYSTRSCGKLVQNPPADGSSPSGLQESVYPARFITKAIEGFIRSQRVLAIQVTPVRVLEAEGMVQILERARIEVRFSESVQSSPSIQQINKKAGPETERGFESFFARHLKNYSKARAWRQVPASDRTLEKTSYLDAPYRYRLYVVEDGVYTLSGQELEDAGADLGTIEAATLSLYCGGKPVPIMVEGGKDGRFDRDDRIVFIGTHNRGDQTWNSRYSMFNVYWLTWGNGVGARFVQVSGAPDLADADTLRSARHRIHLEQDLVYERYKDIPDPSIDHWLWTQLNKNAHPWTIQLPLNDVVPGSDVDLKVAMSGQTALPGVNPDHRVEIRWDDQLVGDLIWDGKESALFEQCLTDFSSLGNSDELSFYLPGDLPGVEYDAVLLNWIEVGYQRQLSANNDNLSFQLDQQGPVIVELSQFTDPNPYILTSEGVAYTTFVSQRDGDSYTHYFQNRSSTLSRFYVLSREHTRPVERIMADNPSQLQSTANGADYIIISHANFIQEAQRLAEYRSGQGLRTRVVDIQDVYDEFSYGIYDPRAIKRFLKYAYRNWSSPAPLYVLLFGDTTHYMEKRKAVENDYLSFIPSMMEYTRSWGMTASDNYFVAVSGDDILPDMYIGRFPANSREDAEVMVDKTINYEQSSDMGEWRRNVLLLSGSDQGLENMVTVLADQHTPDRIVPNFLNTSSESPHYGTTEDMVDYLNGGQALLTFLGHGGGGVYLDTDLFLTRDIELLHNAGRYPVIFSITCFVGHFDSPDTPSLGEELFKADKKGIAAHFGSAGRAYIGYYDNMHESLFDAIFLDNAQTMGEITTLGKYNARQQGAGYWDHMKNYILMGDPALDFLIPKDRMDLSLSNTQLTSGDSLKVTGTVQNRSTGAVTLSAYNEADQPLVLSVQGGDSIRSVQVPVQEGRFEGLLFPLNDLIQKQWNRHWGEGLVRAYYQDGRYDGASATGFYINQPIEVMLSPEVPADSESVYFRIRVPAHIDSMLGGVGSCHIEWSNNKLSWTVLPMQKEQSRLWKTTVALSRRGGARVYYRYVITGTQSRSLTGDIQEYTVRTLSDIWADISTLKVFGQEKVIMSIDINNLGELNTGPFRIRLHSGFTVDPKTILSDISIDAGLSGGADTTISFPLEDAVGFRRYLIRLDPDNAVTEDDENNNIIHISQSIITVERGSGGEIYSSKGTCFIDIPANAVTQNSALNIEFLQDERYLEGAKQVTLMPLNVRGQTTWHANTFRIADSSVVFSQPVTVGFYLNRTDSLTQAAIEKDAVRIYAWSEESETWFGLPTELDTQNQRASAELPPGYSIIGLFSNDDQETPTISVGVNGQSFIEGDLVPSTPTFSILLEDGSGFDVNQDPVRISLDGLDVQEHEYKIFQNSDTRNQMTVTYAPLLDPGDHTLEVEARDINGNVGMVVKEFSVSGEFDLLSLANHPNPFATETIIAFTLSETAEEVTLSIYTVSGRLIRSVTLHEISGYYEYDWDTTDDQGNPVANGVYYLKFTARNGDTKLERIEKLAKLE